MQIFLFILGFALFIGLVLIHEWGHYLAARRNGVEVEEFGLGFPPRAWGRKLKSGMLISLNWLPLGGFVKLKGEYDEDRRPHSFGAASTWAKTKIMLAGVTMNLLAGLALLTILALVGIPKLITPQTVGQEQFTVASDTKVIHQEVRISYVEPGSPADKAGIKAGDRLKSIRTANESKEINSTQDLRSATPAAAGKTAQVEIERRGKSQLLNATLLTRKEVEDSKKTDNQKGYLGVVSTDFQVLRSSWSAPIVALGFTKQLVELTLKGLGQALSGLGSIIAGSVTNNPQAREEGQSKATEQVGGPVAIVAVLWGGGSLGINFVLMVIAILSLTLALINVLPIPALDGGRLSIMLAARALRVRLTRRAEELIHGTGMAILLTLFLLITVVDVRRFL